MHRHFMGVKLVFLYIRASSFLLVIVLMFACRFAFLIVALLRPTFTVRSAFSLFILVAL